MDGFTVNNGHILFIGFRGMKLQGIYKLEENREEQIIKFNDWIQAARSIFIPEKLEAETALGVTIDGWVI